MKWWEMIFKLFRHRRLLERVVSEWRHVYRRCSQLHVYLSTRKIRHCMWNRYMYMYAFNCIKLTQLHSEYMYVCVSFALNLNDHVTVSTDVNECSSMPCLNGAMCLNGDGTFSCVCLPGYEGRLCQTGVCVCVCVYRATKDGCVRQMLMTAFSIYFDLLCWMNNNTTL